MNSKDNSILSDWFSLDNYEVFKNLSDIQLGFELKKRIKLSGMIKEMLEFEDNRRLPVEGPAGSFWGPGILSNILDGRPSFCERVDFMERKSLFEVKDISKRETIDYLARYQRARAFNSIENREGIRLRRGSEIFEDFRQINELENELLNEYAESEDDMAGVHQFSSYASLGEVPLKDEKGDYLTGESIPLTLNIVEYTDEELLHKFSKLLKEMREFYRQDGPTRSKKRRTDDAQKIIDYCAFQIMDIELWRTLYDVKCSNKEMLEATMKTEKEYYKTIKPFLNKISAQYYSLT